MMGRLRKTLIGWATLAKSWPRGLVVLFEHVLGYRLSSLIQAHSARAGRNKSEIRILKCLKQNKIISLGYLFPPLRRAHVQI